MNDYISIISSLIIFLFPYLGRKWFNPQLLSSTVVSLGLLGTFGGIMYGLWVFSVEQIDSSIPQLLEGLKTAFLQIDLIDSLFNFYRRYVSLVNTQACTRFLRD